MGGGGLGSRYQCSHCNINQPYTYIRIIVCTCTCMIEAWLLVYIPATFAYIIVPITLLCIMAVED